MTSDSFGIGLTVPNELRRSGLLLWIPEESRWWDINEFSNASLRKVATVTIVGLAFTKSSSV